MKKFMIDDFERIYTNEDDVAQFIIENAHAYDQYDEMLDECYPKIVIGRMSYYPSQVLGAVDEIAYECGYDDYMSCEYDDIIYYLEEMTDGDEEDFFGFTVKCQDEDEDEDEEEKKK